MAEALHRAVDVARVAHVPQPHQTLPDHPLSACGRLFIRNRTKQEKIGKKEFNNKK